MMSTSGVQSPPLAAPRRSEVHESFYPGHTSSGGADPRWPWHRDPQATQAPCTALPPPTVVERVVEKPAEKVWRSGELKVGDQVEYMSSTQCRFIAAEVKGVCEQDGIIQWVDLDVKKRAQPSRISQKQKEKAIPKEKAVHKNMKEPLKFKEHDKVSYWSDSHGTWMDAVVLMVREDGLYNLDVKKSAKPDRIKVREEKEDQDGINSSGRQARKSEAKIPSVVPTSPPKGTTKAASPPPVPAPQPLSPPPPPPPRGDAKPPAESKASAVPVEDDASGMSTAVGESNGSSAASAANGYKEGSSALPPTATGTRLPSTTTVTAPSPESSPVARSVASMASMASSNVTVYRDLPASQLFLGTGVEGVQRRKPRRGRDSVVISGPLAGGDIDFTGTFDALTPEVRTQILQLLGFSSKAKIDRMSGFCGGLNEGIWFLSGPCGKDESEYEELVLKLVRCHRIASNVPTEAENLVKVHREHPSLSSDETVSFPIKVFSCMDGSTKKHDLIVMRKVPGERLAEVICRKFYNNQLPLLTSIFGKLGQVLAAFHQRYGGEQHGDFQPSNVFYDDDTEAMYFIDIGGMGLPTVDTDVEHFREAMTLLAGAYSPTLHEELADAFERGYASP